jgi:hypothetical protein
MKTILYVASFGMLFLLVVNLVAFMMPVLTHPITVSVVLLFVAVVATRLFLRGAK